MKQRVSALVLVAVLIAGCAGSQGTPVFAPQAPLAEQSAPAVQMQPTAAAPHQSAGGADLVPEQEVHLVPMDSKWELQMILLHPEGWSEFATYFQDGVQSQGPEHQMIHVMTRQLRGQKAPTTVDEMLKFVASEEPDATARQLQIEGTVSAFEVRFTRAGSEAEESVLEYYMYGTTFKQILSFSAPTPVFTEWEPVFRKIQAAFVHSNLDAEPLPGRP